MKIVDATPAHAQILAHIHGEGFTEPWSIDALTGALAAPGAFALIAQDEDGEPLGFVLMRLGGGEAEVLTIATRPAVQRAGVARALMEAAMIKVLGTGAQKLFLEVADDNAPAQALYAGLGFAEVGRRKAYYTRAQNMRVDAIVMSLAL